MEQVERRLSFSGLTINSDPSFRMQTRPVGTGIAPGAGKHREDFGSSRFTLSPRKSKINKIRPASTQSTTALVASSEDDGDIDLFSSPSGTSRHRKVKIHTMTASGSKGIVEGPAGVNYKGEVHEYHPDYLPKPKLPKFKRTNPTNKTRGIGDNTSSRADISDQPLESNLPPKGLPPILKTDNQPPPTPPRLSLHSSSHSPEIKPKRPRPRPAAKRILKRVDSSDDGIDPFGGGAGEEQVVPAVTKERPKPAKKRPEKHIQQKFPLLNDPSFHSDQPLRVVSNLSPPHSHRSSPETSPACSYDVKGKSKAVAVSTDDMEDHTSHAPQPFPLSTSFMDSTPKASKRYPEDETHSGGSERKKLKESLSSGLVQPALPSDIGHINTDFFFLDPNVDPSTLCPWCDQQLPADPTPRLKSLIESVRFKSYLSPRPSNPLGLSAPLAAFVAVCQRHRFESHQIPKAQAKGWPTKIDFGKVKPRVEALRSKLEALLLDQPFEVDGLILLDGDEGKSRDACPFWMEMMKEVKSKGTRAVASSKGQFANFKALQPGYYGELGYLIIHQTIYQLFPLDTINPDSTAPLTPSDFMQRILVPEAAVYLIMEDLQSTYSNAIKILRESVEYGVAMFPDTGGDNEEGTKAADEVVKARARVRRKQLLEEMEIEQRGSSEMEIELELSRPSSPPKPIIAKSRSRRGKAGAKSVTNMSESEQGVVATDWDEPRILTQCPPTAKSRKPMSGYRSDASNASVASRTSTRSMTRNQVVNTRTAQLSDPPPLPPSQPTKRQESASSFRAKTPSHGSSDVEVISDRDTRTTRSRTLDRIKLIPRPPLTDSKSPGKGSGKPALTNSTPYTDSDDELLNSSPFNVKRHVLQRALSTGLEDLEMEETPKLQKTSIMKLHADPWGISTTPTLQESWIPTPPALLFHF